MLLAGIRKYNKNDRNTRVFEKLEPVRKNGLFIDSESFNERWLFQLKQQRKGTQEKIYRTSCLLQQGDSEAATICFTYLFESYNPSSYVLFPAAAYNGNKFASRKIPYSPKLHHPDDISPQKSMIISDVPRLDSHIPDSSLIDRAGACSVPLAGIFDPAKKRCLFLTFPVQTPPGDAGIEFRENLSENLAAFTLMCPVVRESTRYHICDNEYPSEDKAYDFREGFSMEVEFHLFEYSCENLIDFYRYFFHIRHSLSATNKPFNKFSLSECYGTITQKFNRENYVSDHGYYSVGMRENFLQDWQTGWTGGMITTFPLLKSRDSKTTERVLNNFRWFFNAGPTPAGLFWDSGEKGDIWYGGDIRKPHTRNWNLVRKNADALYWIIRQFEWMKSNQVEPDKVWETLTMKVVDTIAGIWEKYGQTGHFINSITGNIAIGGSTSGALLPAAFCHASQYYNRSRYLDIAKEIGTYFFDNYVSKGITCGGPGDALQCPDSESAFAALESFITLYEETIDPYWLDISRHAAHLCSSWVMNYPYQFPTESTLGKMGTDTVGTVFANIQNKHGAPGICINSGSALLRLARYTGDYRYAELLSQITRHLPQMMSHEKHKIMGLNPGWMTERVSTTDWYEGIGEIMSGSTWAETTLMLTYTELPSAYLNIPARVVITFDQLDITYEQAQGPALLIKNPTPYQSTFNIMIDIELPTIKNRNSFFYRELEMAPFEQVKISLQ